VSDYIDLVTAKFDGTVILLGDGTGMFASPIRLTTGASSNSVVVGDFNEDGMLDIAAANVQSNDVSVLLQQ
jgi:hypothetical protein